MSLKNIEKLKLNKYPGRGIVIGLTEDGKNYVQVYWIMGRSLNSRNRIFELESNFIKSKAYDESKVEDPSLIIYYPIKDINGIHIVTNGDQTETIYDQMAKKVSFENSLRTRAFEPDAPHYTPRISGIIDTKSKKPFYTLSILKALKNNPQHSSRQLFKYNNFLRGYGHCIHTYTADKNPVPSFSGEPMLVPIFNKILGNAEFYWDQLNSENRVSLVVKFIAIDSGAVQYKIINKNI